MVCEPRQAGPSEESSLEIIYDCEDRLAHRLKRLNDVLSFKDLNTAEAYVEGRLHVCIHLRPRCGCKDLHVVVGRSKLKVCCHRGRAKATDWPQLPLGLLHVPCAGLGVRRRHKMSASTRAESQGKPVVRLDASQLQFREAELQRLQQSPVLIPIVELVQSPEHLTGPTFVGLGVAKELYDGSGQMFFKPSHNSFHVVDVIDEWELEPLDFASWFMEHSAAEPRRQHFVEGRPKVVDGIRGEAFQVQRDRLDGNAPYIFCPLLIQIGDNAIRASFKKGADCGIEILDVGFGPFNLSESRGKGMANGHL